MLQRNLQSALQCFGSYPCPIITELKYNSDKEGTIADVRHLTSKEASADLRSIMRMDLLGDITVVSTSCEREQTSESMLSVEASVH